MPVLRPVRFFRHPAPPAGRDCFSGGGKGFPPSAPAHCRGTAPGQGGPPVQGGSSRGRIFHWVGPCGWLPSGAVRAIPADLIAGGIPAQPAAARHQGKASSGWLCRWNPQAWRRADAHFRPGQHWQRAPPAQQTPSPCAAPVQGRSGAACAVRLRPGRHCSWPALWW